MRTWSALLLLGLAACGDGSDPAQSRRDDLAGAWQPIGNGVTLLDTGNPLGSNVFIGYAGFNINLGQSQAWVGTLYDARLRELGVRYVFAVQGPADPGYNALEIGNSAIAARLAALLKPELGFIVIAGHSSGSFVADELLQQLDTGADPFNAIGSRTVYFDLDGDQKYVAASGINRLRNAWYVNAFNPSTGVASWNHGAMSSLGATFAGKGGSFEYNAASSGCSAGGCVHISLINSVPHDPNGGSGVDYADFGGRPVNQWWLDLKRSEAGLGQCASRFLTQGLIQARYVAMGGCASVLGSPTTDELVTADGAGRYSRFTWGAIYWSFFTGAHDVRGAIEANWAAHNYENGALGYPTSDELVTADTLGRYNRFQHGAVYWTFATGAHAVVEPVYGAWAKANFENGALGYPISDTHPVPGGVQNAFVHGTLTVLADGTSQLVMDTADAGQGAGPLPTVGDGDAGVAFVPAGNETEGTAVGFTAPANTDLNGVVGGCSATGGNLSALVALLMVVRFRRRPARAAAVHAFQRSR